MITVRKKVDSGKLKAYAIDVPQRMPQVVKRGAFRLQAAAQTSPMMPVDTGALRASMNSRESTPLQWTVQDGVLYGVFQELGTKRGVTARHFLGGAAENTASEFFDDVKRNLQP